MPAIETNDLTKVYSDDVVAIDGLDLAVEKGEVFGFLGPNGAGKSTTIDVLLDYARPSTGSATVLGYDTRTESVEMRKHVGVLPEGYALYDRLTGRRHLAFAADWRDADAPVDGLLDRVGLAGTDADRPGGDYSKGMQQRLALAMALVGEPALLVLDEPSSGLDPNGIRLLRQIVREEANRGTTVFFSSHVLSQVEAVCDRVGILADGELVAVDTVDGLRAAAGTGAELRLRVPRDADVDVADVEAVEGVASVTRTDGILRVATVESRAKARTVARLADAGVDVIDVDSEQVSLEDVFAAYTEGAGLPEDREDGPADGRRVPA